jgi:hypothetical protein
MWAYLYLWIRFLLSMPGKPEPLYDQRQAVWPEPFSCANCGHCGPISIHAECQRCSSGAVMPVSTLEAR